MRNRLIMWALAVCCAFNVAPAYAGRTAIDQDPNTGAPINYYLSGYCDFNGDDCYPNSGSVLPYKVNVRGAGFTNQVDVTGNGLVTFGEPFSFFQDPVQSAILDQANGGPGPLLTDYGVPLVSAGQSNTLDFGGVFFQSGSIGVDALTGVISAEWFTCYAPSGPGVCPKSNRYSLTLTPTSGGFAGHFDFSGGTPEGSDKGYVSGGVFTPTGNDFLLPATFQGLTTSVPEPASWAMMIVGFGLTGGILRRGKKLEAVSS